MRSLLETGATTDVVGDGTPVIVVRNLRVAYGGHEPVRGIDLVVWRSEIFALLGPNGAGKTTTVEILEGHRRRSGGTVSVLGADPQYAGPDWRARIAIGLQECEPQASLTELLFLDEPTTGLHSAARRSAWRVISGLRDLGKTVLLATPYTEEADALADRIAVLAAGRIVATGTPRTLTQGAR